MHLPHTLPHTRRGFTLVELLVSLLIVSILSAGTYTFFRMQLYALRAEELRIELKENADLGLDFLVRELRMAGARPVHDPDDYTCAQLPPPGAVPACTGFAAITDARPQSITFQYDQYGNVPYTDPPDDCPNDPNERLTYTYAGGQLMRTDHAIATTRAVATNVASDFLIRYYRADGTELLPGTGTLSGANLLAVSSIVIRLRTTIPHPDPLVSGNIVSVQTSTVHLRNPRC